MRGEGLIPQSQRGIEKRKEIGRMGGIASGKSKQERKTIKKILDELLNAPITDYPKYCEVARKLGLTTDKTMKELFVTIGLFNSIRKAKLDDIEKLARLIGEDKLTNSDDLIKKIQIVISEVENAAKAD